MTKIIKNSLSICHVVLDKLHRNIFEENKKIKDSNSIFELGHVSFNIASWTVLLAYINTIHLQSLLRKLDT